MKAMTNRVLQFEKEHYQLLHLIFVGHLLSGFEWTAAVLEFLARYLFFPGPLLITRVIKPLNASIISRVKWGGHQMAKVGRPNRASPARSI